MKLKRIYLIATFLLAIASGSFAQEPQKSGASLLNFPDVEGWTRGDSAPIPGDNGIALSYDSPARERVTVYVYTRGAIDAKNPLSGTVKDELEGAVEAVRTVAEMGVYSDVRASKTETSAIGGASGKSKALHVNLTFKAGGNKMNSEIFVLPYQGQIVKVRSTRPADIAADRAASYTLLLAALDKLFANPLPAGPSL